VIFFIYLTPLIPLSFKGEGGSKERGASPLLDTLVGRVSPSKEDCKERRTVKI